MLNIQIKKKKSLSLRNNIKSLYVFYEIVGVEKEELQIKNLLQQ